MKSLGSSFVPKDFIWKKTLRMFRLLWVSWSSCRRWVGWPAGWTDCRSPERQKNGFQCSTQNDDGMEEVCESIRVWEERTLLQTRERLARCSSCTIDDLATSTPWSLSIQVGGGAPTFSERTEHYSTNIDPAQNWRVKLKHRRTDDTSKKGS